MNSFAVTVAWVLAALLLGPTLLGLVQNLLLRETTLFIATTAHSLFYLATATGFAVVAMLGAKSSVRFMQVLGVVYILISLFEFVTLGSNVANFQLSTVQTGLLSNVIHLGLGITIAGAGWILKNCQCRMIFINRRA